MKGRPDQDIAHQPLDTQRLMRAFGMKSTAEFEAGKFYVVRPDGGLEMGTTAPDGSYVFDLRAEPDLRP